MLIKLPWELLHQVLYYLCKIPGPIRYGHTSRNDEELLNSTTLENHHFKSAFVGHTLLQAIVETHYKINTFMVENAHDIPEFLKGGSPYVRVPQECLRSIVVELRIHPFVGLDDWHDRFKEDCEDLQTKFKLLLHTPHPKRFKLELLVTAPSRKRLEIFLKSMKDLYHRFVKTGDKVEVTCRNSKKLRYP
jgi:hypothetical protein